MFRPHLLWLALCLPVLGCEAMYDSMDFDREKVTVYEAAKTVDPGDPGAKPELRVMAWNVKYGAARIPFWFDCWGDRVKMSEAEVEANMAKLYAHIKEVDPDILMVEEIEVNSRRSAYYQMVQGILDHTNLNYAAYIQTWKARYVAADGVGRMDLGNAIFSRYPIAKAERIRQVDRTDQDALTSAFYIKRAIGRVEVELRSLKGTGGKRVVAFVVHTEAYDNDGTKQKQVKQIHEVLSAETLPFVIGGDFNEVPPTATRTENFPDERETAVCSADFAQPPYTPEIMKPFYDDFRAWVPLSQYDKTLAEQSRYFTHTVLGPDETNEKGEPGDWNRTLDYLFIDKSGNWKAGSGTVLQRKGQTVMDAKGAAQVLVEDPLTLSDHAPVFGIWEVK
ncbi:MAG: endonuclease/exonuclease/phosphatase family protein [Myxococcales bacterium]|nr:endonuclease/exonuclease/phosphatase family protein [Myxococcales bacterium]